MDLTRHYDFSAPISAPPEAVFALLDDHTRLAAHMSQSSWRMGGGRMEIQLDEGRGRHVGSKIRLSGRVFGLRMEVEEIVTERNLPYRKVWETQGEPELLVIGRYRMGFEIKPRQAESLLTVFIDYALPEKRGARSLGYLLAQPYARWCTKRMVQDAVKHFSPSSGALSV